MGNLNIEENNRSNKIFLAMTPVASQLESILFVASKPISLKKMAKVLNASPDEILAALENLRLKFNQPESGMLLLQNNDEWQMATNPDNKEVSENFIKAEVTEELTRPQLETLTVIAYCGPITKPELETIRGVNCSLIIRNLLLRGLVKETENPAGLLPAFEVTMDFLCHLGLSSLSELPQYEELHKHEHITLVLEEIPLEE